ncbi:hypothetical protein EY643_03420 [Halioglobus maricola]|uniref:Phytanoyl-CoA dioxygenase n=1 Tax=Halioglobus maricola TaxID=2601894 RepID=A0A5P9NGW2_9GAMM|nr:phytanoyl-CoA dioxygenase family protein [Halioglobus maricola]QFU74776.1 hypothetical protein EY643_03420 [Halioglobus maricola]
MILSPQQCRFFEIFGFLTLPGLFRDEQEQMSRAFDALFEERQEEVVEWVHETHDNRMRRIVTDATDKSDYFRGLLNDPRICGVASGLLGEGYVYRGSDCSIYDCGTRYHRDAYGANLSFDNIKMALYLEPLSEQTGAVRVIPGSHHQGGKFTQNLNKHLETGFQDLGLSTEEVPATVLACEPGDLLLWNYRLMHATSYGGNARRMLALEFSERYERDDIVELDA